MDATSVSKILINILLGCFSITIISWVFVSAETFIHDYKREKREEATAKREEAAAKRDEEYHFRRMKELNK